MMWFDPRYPASQVLAPAGSNSLPTYTFSTDPDTGMSSAGTNALNFSTGGTSRINITSGGSMDINTAGAQLRFQPGSAATPGLAFTTDTDTGIFLNAANDIGLTTGGSRRWYLTSGGEWWQDGTNGGQIKFQKANATIDFAGAMGNSTKDPTVDAPVGWVEIKIAGTTRYIPAYAA